MPKKNFFRPPPHPPLPEGLLPPLQTWPVKLTKAMKILHNTSRHLQLTVLLWKGF